MKYLNRSSVVAGHQLVKFNDEFVVFRVVEPDLLDDNEDQYEPLFKMSWEEVLEACLQWKLEEACLQWKLERDKANENK